MLRNLCEVLQYCHTAQGVKLIVIGATLVPEFMYVPSTISYGNEEEEEQEVEEEEGEEEDQENEEGGDEEEEDNDEEDQEKIDVVEEEEEKKVVETSVAHIET